MPPPCERISFGQCLCGKGHLNLYAGLYRNVRTKNTIWNQRPDESPHGSYCLPIASAGQTLGLINISIEEGHEKTAEEERFLAAVADTLAAVMMRQQAEMEKNQLKEELAEAEKTAALGRITASVADKIRNPLTAIGGFARRLDKKIPEGSKEKEYYEVYPDRGRPIGKGIAKCPFFIIGSRAERPEKCDLKEIVQEALGIFEEPCKERSIAIERSFGDVPVIEGERELFLVAIENLIVNAMDAMPLGGRLTMATGTESIKGVAYAAVKVSDTGEGIKEEDLNRIFEPFFTTKVSANGSDWGFPWPRESWKITKGGSRWKALPERVRALFSISLPRPHNALRHPDAAEDQDRRIKMPVGDHNHPHPDPDQAAG